MCKERVNKSHLKGLFLLLLLPRLIAFCSLYRFRFIIPPSDPPSSSSVSSEEQEPAQKLFFQAPFKLAFLRRLSEDEGFWVSVLGPGLIWAY